MSTTQIDTGLSRYYSNKRVQYFDENGVGLFQEWCDVNGYDTDGVEAELDADPSDCCLLEFDEDFPTTKKGDDRILEIFNAIKNASINPEFGLKKFFVTVVIKIFEKFAFNKAAIVNTINTIYNKAYEKYNIPDKAQIVIHTQDDMDKIIKYLYDNYQAKKEIAASDTDPKIKSIPTFAANALSIRVYELTAIIATYYRLINVYDYHNYANITDTIISYVALEDADKYIEELYPAKKSKKKYKMIVKDSSNHFFDELELKCLGATRLNAKMNCKDSNILGKGSVLRLNVLENVTVNSSHSEVVGAIFNKNDIIMNIDGNLEISHGARIKSKNGTIILNVGGDIYLKAGAKIVTNGNIYIKCNNLMMADKAFIETYDFGEKYNKINYITLNYQLNKKNKRILYGDTYIEVKNNLSVHKNGCKIKSGDIRIKCGGVMDITRMKHMLALRNNVNITCNELKVSTALIQKNIDARNKTMIKCNKLNIMNR